MLEIKIYHAKKKKKLTKILNIWNYKNSGKPIKCNECLQIKTRVKNMYTIQIKIWISTVFKWVFKHFQWSQLLKLKTMIIQGAIIFVFKSYWNRNDLIQTNMKNKITQISLNIDH